MNVVPVGVSALLLELAPEDVPGRYEQLVRRRDEGAVHAVDIVPGARTILLDGVPDPSALAEALRDLPAPPPASTPDGRLVEIACRYDGPELPAVARLWGTDEDGVVRIHTSTAFRVAFCGFVPGFAYLAGLPPERVVPRLATPRARVPAGSVGLADGYTGVYPAASPGGWQLIGSTDARLFDPDADPPALLTPGTRVRFREIG